MKKSFWRTAVSIILIAVLMISLGACTGPAAVDGSGNDTSGQESANEPENQEAEAESEKELVTLKILGKETDIEGGTLADRGSNMWWQRFEEMLAAEGIAIDFEIIEDDQYQTVLQTRLASGTDLPDMFYVTSKNEIDDATAIHLAKSGTIVSMKDILENHGGEKALNFINERCPFMLGRITDENGDYYWLTGITCQSYQGRPEGTGLTVSIRKD